MTGRWHIDEAYNKVGSQWMYIYRAIDSAGDTVEFWFSEQRDQLSASGSSQRRWLGMTDPTALLRQQTNREAFISCDTTNPLQNRSRRWPKRNEQSRLRSRRPGIYEGENAIGESHNARKNPIKWNTIPARV